jgi:hypothetical protein
MAQRTLFSSGTEDNLPAASGRSRTSRMTLAGWSTPGLNRRNSHSN